MGPQRALEVMSKVIDYDDPAQLAEYCRAGAVPGRQDRDYLVLEQAIRRLYGLGDPETARSVVAKLHSLELSPRISAVVRRLRLQDPAFAFAADEVLTEAGSLAASGELDKFTSVAIFARFGIDPREGRDTPQRRSLVRKLREALPAEDVSRAWATIRLRGRRRFEPPPSIGPLPYALARFCDSTRERGDLRVYRLTGVRLYKRNQALAILAGDRPVGALFNEQGLLETQLSPELDMPNVRIRRASLLAFDGFPGSNYCHWMMDTLFRIHCIQAAFPDARQASVLLQQSSDFVADSLRLTGLASPEQIYEVGRNALLDFDELYVCTSSFVDFCHPAQWASDTAVSALTEMLLPAGRPKKGTLRLQISRKGDSRCIANEEDLANRLSQHGFETVLPGRLTFTEQQRLFSQAEAIVAGHGSGLANLLFAPTTAHVLELFPPRYGTASFFPCSSVIGHRYVAAVNAAHQDRNEHIMQRGIFARDDFSVDVDAIEAYVSNSLN